MTEIQRLIFSASAMPPAESRMLLEVLFAKDRAMHPMEASRDKHEQNFHQSLVRVLGFAKHETLRNLHRQMYQNRPIMGQDQSEDPHHDATKIAFAAAALNVDLNSTLHMEIPPILEAGAQDALDAAEVTADYTLPKQDVYSFIAGRQNLLSGVPDEIYQEIQAQLTEGMKAGETLAQLSQRISNTFDEISQGRAKVIAATETAAAYAFAGNAAAQANGIQYKKWIHSVIPKVPRPDHLEIDGLIVPFDQPFPVGDPQLMYPHAPDGSPEDVINCRCIMVPVTQAEYLAQD